jgi:ERCC4-related helicase
MDVVKILNKIKDELRGLDLSSLDEEIRDDFSLQVDKCLSDITQSISIIDKYNSDKDTMEKMRIEIRDKIKKNHIYDGLDDKTLSLIEDRIIRKKDINFLDDEGLREYIEDKLRDSSVDNLITKAYSKTDIIKLGEAINTADVTEIRKYDAGMGVLRDLVKTPRGREEAIAYGTDRLLKNVISRRYYLSLYYGITR